MSPWLRPNITVSARFVTRYSVKPSPDTSSWTDDAPPSQPRLFSRVSVDPETIVRRSFRHATSVSGITTRSSSWPAIRASRISAPVEYRLVSARSG